MDFLRWPFLARRPTQGLVRTALLSLPSVEQLLLVGAALLAPELLLLTDAAVATLDERDLHAHLGLDHA